MEGNNNAPFKEGQKVVALKNSKVCPIKKDDVVTVTACFLRNCKCNRWTVAIKEAPGVTIYSLCKSCGYEYLSPVTDHSGDYTFFAPIQRQPLEISIDQEVLDSLPKITEERADVKPQEATVTNQLLNTIDEMIALLPQMPEEEKEAYAKKIDTMITRTCKLIRGEEC